MPSTPWETEVGRVEGRPPDFELELHGSVALLIPLTATAEEWLELHIGKDNGYQPFWPKVVVEPRFLEQLVGAILEAGMRIRGQRGPV